MNEEQILEDCGLSKTESQVYLELLKLGSSTAYKVSKEANLHKANTYGALKSLLEKGLVSSYIKENNTYYQTTDLSSILNILKRKEERIAEILPKLKLMEGLAVEKSEASIHKGVPIFMNLLYNLLEYKKPIYIYGIPKVAPEIVKHYIMSFHKERIKRRIRMDHIYNYDASERIKLLRKMSFTNARSLPKSIKSTASTIICGPEVLIEVWLESDNSVKTIRIKDEEIAKSYIDYFQFLWKLAR